MADKIGECHKCGETAVRITHGWKTRANQHCTACNTARIRNRRLLQARNALRKGHAKGGDKKTPIKRLSKLSGKPTKAREDLLKMDAKMNREIWAERKHVCFECGKKLHERPLKGYFSHVHSKGARPDLRFVRENVVLHCFPGGCHAVWEFGAREFMPMTQKLFDEIAGKFPDNKNGRESV